MKVSLSELGEFLLDPRAWAAGKTAAAAGNRRVGYVHVTRMGIYRYHKSNSLASARTALAGYLDSYGLTNIDRREIADANLERYAAWFERSANFAIAHSLRMRLDLSAGLYVSGQIHRVDLVANSAIHQPVMLEAGANSPDRVLASVIAMGYAAAASRDLSEITPAHQNLDGSGLTRISVSQQTATNVLERLNLAANEAAKILNK